MTENQQHTNGAGHKLLLLNHSLGHHLSILVHLELSKKTMQLSMILKLKKRMLIV
jgi:hypothetical protein